MRTAATIYLSLLGPAGLREVAEICLQRAHSLQARLASLPGVSPLWNGPFFHEFALRLPGGADTFRRQMRARGIDPGIPLGRFFPDLGNALLVTVTEVNAPTALEEYVAAAREVLAEGPSAGLGRNHDVATSRRTDDDERRRS